jgi:hypothetical protein
MTIVIVGIIRREEVICVTPLRRDQLRQKRASIGLLLRLRQDLAGRRINPVNLPAGSTFHRLMDAGLRFIGLTANHVTCVWTEKHIGRHSGVNCCGWEKSYSLMEGHLRRNRSERSAFKPFELILTGILWQVKITYRRPERLRRCRYEL